MLMRLQKKLNHISTITTHKLLSWQIGYFGLNISHSNATKQHAILEVAKITHEMIEVGDTPND